MDSQDSLIDVLGVLWKWRKKIILVTVIAAIGSVLFSLMLSNYYQSTTIFFAASTDLNKPEQVFGQTNKATRYYGDDYDNDRLLTVSSSPELIHFLIDSFKMAEHYKMKVNTPKRQFKLEKKFRSNFEALKTKFGAISLSFEDKDPELAAAVVNEARKQVGEKSLRLLKYSQAKRIATYKKSIATKSQELRRLSDTLEVIRKRYNIYDAASQGELLAKMAAETESNLAGAKAALEKFENMRGRRDTVQVLTARVAGLKKQLETVYGSDTSARFSIKLFREGMNVTQAYTNRFYRLSGQLDAEKEKLRQLMSIYESNAPTIILAEKGEIPKIKSRPKRSILVIAATLAAFIFSVLGALLFENIGKMDLKRIKGV